MSILGLYCKVIYKKDNSKTIQCYTRLIKKANAGTEN